MSNRDRLLAPAVSDAGKRIADTYALHRSAQPYDSIGKWFAAALHDGTTDGVLYDTKRDAVTHQHHDEDFYCYVQVTPGQMTPEDADILLKVQRRMYDNGLRLADPDRPDGGRDMIRRLSREDQANQLRALFRGDRAPSNIRFGGQ